MATSLNKMIDGSKLFPGYKFLVTVDTYSENVVLVTGFIGSRKYKGALLDLPCNYFRGCAADNVFTSDFSSKNNYSFTNMAITNYYSHRKFKNNSNTTLISLNKRAKDNFICTNCKMKISYFPKKESKSPPIESSKLATNSCRSDITVLKQTLSYPDISDDIIPSSSAQHNFISISNIPEKTLRTLKRKKHQTNHMIPDKKPKIIVTESEMSFPLKNQSKSHDNVVVVVETHQQCKKKIENEKLPENNTDKTPEINIDNNNIPLLENRKLIEIPQISHQIIVKTQENNNCENCSLITKKKTEKIEENQMENLMKKPSKTLEEILERFCLAEDNSEHNLTIDFPIVQQQQQQQQNCSETITKETEIELENNIDDNFFDIEDVSETQIYDDYRSMPLSLVKLNHINSMENDKTSEDSLLRECPKPKKIWMKMIENEDIEKSSDMPTHSSESAKHHLLHHHQQQQQQQSIMKNKSSIHGKSSHSNRSYKIKQTFYDKVILTIDKRPEKHKLDAVPKDSVDDIYTFSDESEIISIESAAVATAQEPPNNNKSYEDASSVDLIIEDVIKATDESIKSSHSSSSKSSSLSTKISLQNLSDDISMKSELNNVDIIDPLPPPPPPPPPLNMDCTSDNKITVKMEPDSTTDGNSLFTSENNLVTVISSCESNKGVEFNLNDIVWAKITGYPFWPAKIISFSQEDDTFIGCIEWYAWNEVSFIKVNNLFHFNQYFPSKYQKRNRNGKYQEAVKLAKFDCGMIDSIPVTTANTATTNTNTTTTTGSSSAKGSDTDGSDSNAASYTSASL